MKTWILLAAAVLAPLNASAVVMVNENTRAELLREIEAARTALLPQAEPLPQVTARFQPRLNNLKETAQAAKSPAELTKTRKDFGDWKTAVMTHLHADNARSPLGGASFAAFSAQKTAEMDFVQAIRQQFSVQRAESQMSVLRAASLRPQTSWSNVFDQSSSASRDAFSAFGSAGVVTVPPALAANDPARYNKIRALLLSQGVSASIVDTAIAEGRRQKVDPMIVLSVISQESNFRKNARNSGSGATGLMQLVPETAADMGVRGSLYDPAANIRAGVKYLNWIANSFFKMNLDMSDLSRIPAEKLDIVLASYNWGIGNVRRVLRKHGAAALDRVAPRETRNYIAEIPSRISAWFASI